MLLMNYCVIELYNTTQFPLTVTAADSGGGYWNNLPKVAPAQQSITFTLSQPPLDLGLKGASGSVQFQIGDFQAFISMAFSDPVEGDNTATGSISGEYPFGLPFWGCVGDDPNQTRVQYGVPASGDPVYLYYTLMEHSGL